MPRSRGYSSSSPSELELERLRAELDEHRRTLAELHEEPMLTATVVEVRPGTGHDDNAGRMSISLGPGNALDIGAIPGARVGCRVRCHRNSMQAIDVLPDDAAAPAGTIVTVQRQVGKMIEAEVMGTVRAFKSELALAKGERAIVDASLSFVIGTLGMPPQTYSYAPKVHVAWDDVGGHAEAKAALREAIELPFAHPELFAAYGKQPVRGVLLSGPTGCGKTLLAKAAATSIAKAHGKTVVDDGGFVYVKGPELLNAYIGNSEQAIRRLFAAARTFKQAFGYPSVIFLDECDALLGTRDNGPQYSINATTVPQFLAEMDGLDDQATMLILATNRPDMLDPAIVREGRVDRRVKIGRPNQADAAAIFAIHLRARPLAGLQGERAAQVAELAELGAAHLYDHTRVVRELAMDSSESRPLRLRDFASGAMIAGIVEQASTAAMTRDIAAGAVASGITLADLVWATDRAQAALAHVSHAEAIRELLERTPAIGAEGATITFRPVDGGHHVAVESGAEPPASQGQEQGA